VNACLRNSLSEGTRTSRPQLQEVDEPAMPSDTQRTLPQSQATWYSIVLPSKGPADGREGSLLCRNPSCGLTWPLQPHAASRSSEIPAGCWAPREQRHSSGHARQGVPQGTQEPPPEQPYALPPLCRRTPCWTFACGTVCECQLEVHHGISPVRESQGLSDLAPGANRDRSILVMPETLPEGTKKGRLLAGGEAGVTTMNKPGCGCVYSGKCCPLSRADGHFPDRGIGSFPARVAPLLRYCSARYDRGGLLVAPCASLEVP
jgi:hypothetical protein